MKKEDYLESLRKLLFASLEKDDAENAYSYYVDLFEEEDADAIIKRIGSPEDVVKTFLNANDEIELIPAPHRIGRGFKVLFSSMKNGGHFRISVLLYFILLLVLFLGEAYLIINRLLYLVIDISIGFSALNFILADMARLSFLVLVVMLSLRHLPYLVTERRR